MTNNEKFKEYEKILAECREKGLLGIKPDVYEMERLKYSDDPLHRKICAICKYADSLYMDKILNTGANGRKSCH